MQNWKIKRMGKEKINEWMKAINNVLRIYETRTVKLTLCPFCNISGLDRIGCDNCLWYIIEEFGCNYFASRIGFSSALTARKQKRWHEARIPMLKRWKKILKAELARRKQ